MTRTVPALACAAAAGLLVALTAAPADAADPEIERGQYLTSFGGCFDCHTPGYFFGKPDMDRYLGGSEVGFAIPGQGVFVGPNLTPDKETGLGDWTDEQIVTALQKGVRPDGRILAPIMPWRSFAKLTRDDAFAIARYLKSAAAQEQGGRPVWPEREADRVRMKLVPPEGAAPPKQD